MITLKIITKCMLGKENTWKQTGIRVGWIQQPKCAIYRVISNIYVNNI